jgi:BCD family chlorophyll transporter-like MFS transporter
MTTSDSQLPAAGQVVSAESQDSTEPFALWRVLRLSTFQIGSAMGDILVTSIWNRIMISNFGITAWPVGLLIAFRFFLSPLSLWAGHRSDTHPLRGLHRTPYIWFGRFMMVISFPFLGFSLGRLADDPADFWGWLMAVICFTLYGVGTLISGSPYLTLVRDSVPKSRQGLAVSVVETALIAFFPIVAISFGLWLEEYEQSLFWQVILFTMVVGGFFWWFAIAGAEKPGAMPGRKEVPSDGARLSTTFIRIARDRRTRRFFLFLALGMLSAWAQDNILEPFGADVFDLGVGATTRFNAYWQGMTVVVLVAAVYFFRRRRPEQQTTVTKIGLGVMAVGMILLGASSTGTQFRLVQIGLVAFGAGFGLFTFGAFSLMVVMTTDKEAGAYLGLWTVCVLLFRGLGISLGSVLRDVFLGLTGSPELSYALIFVLEALGLVVAALSLSRAYLLSFARDSGRLEDQEEFVTGIDL